MRGRRTALRNVLLFGLAVGVLAALIGLMYLRKPVRILPPESPEVAAKRHAPENAYFTLVEAVKLLPPPPAPLIVPDPEYPQLQTKYRPPKESPQEWLQILRPEDDPEFAKYLEQAAPAVAKLREALAKPYFLRALEWSAYENFADEPEQPLTTNGLLMVGALLVVNGAKSLRDGRDSNEAYAYFHDALRLGQLLAGEERAGFRLEYCVPRWLGEAAPAFSDETLLAAQQDLRALRGTLDAAAIAALEFKWRRLDNARRFSPRGSSGPAAAAATVIMGVGLKRLRGSISENRELLREAVLLRPPGWQVWTNAHPEFRQRWIETPSVAGEIRDIMSERTTAETACLGAETIMALERYRRANGRCPDTLEALAPQFLPTTPQDPFAETGTPLKYRLEDNDYLLYSMGMNQSDEGGKGRGDIVLHGKSE